MSHQITRTVVRREEQHLNLDKQGDLVVDDVDLTIEPPERHQCSCGESFDTLEAAVEHANEVGVELIA